jgi:uncharacterized membrane protein YdfJ with MMPL/SSD domain
MLGLALAIDYSLCITSRCREELARGRTVEQAVERAVGTAGKAVLFSGIAVAIGLSGLLWFRAAGLSSIGLGGSIVVVCSVLFSLTFLPALLGMLGPRVNALSVGGLIRRLGRRQDPAAVRESRWARVANAVMHRPIAVLLPVLAFLFILGSPFFRLEQGVPDATVYPAGVPSRDAWVALQTEFRAGETTPIVLLVDTTGSPTSERSISAVLAYVDQISKVEGIDRVEGPFTLKDPASGQALTAAQVAALFQAPAALPRELAAALERLEGAYIRGNTVRLTRSAP